MGREGGREGGGEQRERGLTNGAAWKVSEARIVGVCVHVCVCVCVCVCLRRHTGCVDMQRWWRDYGVTGGGAVLVSWHVS